MGLLDYFSNNQSKNSGLLGDFDPDSRNMVAMALINKFANPNNSGTDSGFNDIYTLMAQQQKMKQQEMMNQYRISEAQRKAALETEKQNQLNSMAQGIVDYKPVANAMKPVIEEYKNVPLLGGESLQIPTESYLKNLFSASDQARSAPKSAFTNDPAVRQIAANLVRTGEASNIKEAMTLLTNGGAYTLNRGDKRFSGTGEMLAENEYTPQYGQPQSVMGADGKPKLVQFNNQGGTSEVSGYAPIPKAGMTVRDSNGNVIFEQGGWGQGANIAPTSSTQSSLQSDVISKGDTLNRLDQIAKDYKTSYLTYPGQARAAVGRFVGKVTGKSGDKEFIQGEAKFRTGMEQVFNQYRKEITGAAASVQELDRLKQSMLNRDMAPEEFEASYDQFRGLLNSSLQLKQKYLRQGVPVDQIGAMIDADLFSNNQQQPNSINSSASQKIRRFNPQTGRIE